VADEAWQAWIPRFDAWADTYDEDTRDPWFAYEDAWSFVERSLRAGLGGLAGRSVVDVGCGTGEFLRRLADEGVLVMAVEPSAGMREVAAAKVPGARIMDGHLASIPLEDGAVDAAIATYVVSHLEPADQPEALRELLRVVAGTGPIVVVDVPTVEPDALPRVREVLAGAGRTEQADWFERGYGLAVPEWCAMLEDAGRRVRIESLGPLLIGVAGLPRPT